MALSVWNCAWSAAARRHLQIGQRDRIEVVVGQRDEAEAAAPQLDDLLDDDVARRAGAGAGRRSSRPSRTSSASGSRGRSAPTPTCSGRPASGPSAPAADPPARPGRPRRPAAPRPAAQSSSTCAQTRSPSPLTTACAPPSSRASSGNSVAWMPPKTTVAPASRAMLPDLVAAQRVARVDADADDVAGGDDRRVERFERFVGDDADRRTRAGCGLCQHVQPAGRDDADAKRHVARIDQMNAQIWILRVTPNSARGAAGSRVNSEQATEL